MRNGFLDLAAGLMVVLLVGCASGTSGTRSQAQQHAGHSSGTVHFPATCSEPAQAELDRAVTLLHHMTYPQAREAFQELLELADGGTRQVALEEAQGYLAQGR